MTTPFSNIDIQHVNIQALQMASEILCVLRSKGYIVPAASEKSQYASAHFLRFLLGDSTNPEYRLASLRSSVDNCVSLIAGADFTKAKNNLSDKDFADMLRTIQDLPSCVQSIVEGAFERLESLVALDGLASSGNTSSNDWETILDGSGFNTATPGLSDIIATTTTAKKRKL